MLYICQLDYPDVPYPTHTKEPENERGPHTTVKTSGCGLCAAMMTVDRLLPNVSFTLDEALALSYQTEANSWSGTSYRLFAPAFAERFGLKLEVTQDTGRLAEALKTGACAVAHCRKHADGTIGTFTAGGHYITVFGVEPDGRFAILDPSLKPGKFDEPGREGKVEIVHGFVCLCRPEVLAKDVAQTRGFYIFSR